MSRYFIHDLESDKLHIFTAGKPDWQAISKEDQATIKRNCLFSGRRSCWISKAKYHKAKIYLGDLLSKLGFADRGSEGEKLSFAEQVEARQIKAEERADRMETRSDKAISESESHRQAAHSIVDQIPLGQPILVGHRSEARHRRDLARHDAHMHKFVDAAAKAEHYERRAEAARATASGKQYSDPAFLGRRIREQEAEERLLQRRLAENPSDEYRERLTSALEETQDKLDFYRHCLASLDLKAFNKLTLSGKKEVLIRGTWHEIVKLNPTTVAVPNICYPSPESQRKYAAKYPYAEIKDAR